MQKKEVCSCQFWERASSIGQLGADATKLALATGCPMIPALSQNWQLQTLPFQNKLLILLQYQAIFFKDLCQKSFIVLRLKTTAK